MKSYRNAIALLCLASVAACSNPAPAEDPGEVPSALDTMDIPIHPGMVDSTGAVRFPEKKGQP